jgi:hypothetical protein
VKRFALLLLLASACQKNDSTPAAGSGNGLRPGTQLKVGPPPAEAGAAGDPCAAVADGIRAIWDRQVRDAESPDERKAAEDMRHKLAGRLERHCRDDAWTVDAIECIRSGQPCRGKLTPDQQAKLDADKPDTQ